MSLLPSLRASSSRIAVAPPASILRRQFHPSTSSAALGTTVQDADKSLAELQKRSMQMKKHGATMDMTAMPTPVMEKLAEPAYKISWLFKTGGWSYSKDRFIRFRTTRKFLNDMLEKDIFPKKKGKNVFASIYESICCLRPTYKAGYLINDLRKVYEGLNTAQAAGDEIVARSLATGQALSLAQKISKTKRNMKWELVKMNTQPKLISARMSPLDAEGKIVASQVVVRFDAEQALTMKGPSEAQTRQQRVIENCVFERLDPGSQGWRLKETLETTVPKLG